MTFPFWPVCDAVENWAENKTRCRTRNKAQHKPARTELPRCTPSTTKSMAHIGSILFPFLVLDFWNTGSGNRRTRREDGNAPTRVPSLLAHAVRCGCRVNLPATDSAPLQLGAVRGQDGAFDAAVLGRRGGCGALLAVSVPANTSCEQLNRPPAPPASLSSPHSSQPSLTPPRVFHFLVNT